MADDVVAHQREVFRRPSFVIRKLVAKPLTFVAVGVAPEVHHLVERADLGDPAALELPVVVAADRDGDVGRVRDGLHGAGTQGDGTQLADHVISSLCRHHTGRQLSKRCFAVIEELSLRSANP